MEFNKKLCVSHRDHCPTSIRSRDALNALHIQLIFNKMLKRCEFKNRTLGNKINFNHEGPEV